MSRGSEVYLQDIAESIARIERYVGSRSFDEFSGDELRVDAVVRNLEVIGEAVKQIPLALRSRVPEIDWKRIAGLRDILITSTSESTCRSSGT